MALIVIVWTIKIIFMWNHFLPNLSSLGASQVSIWLAVFWLIGLVSWYRKTFFALKLGFQSANLYHFGQLILASDWPKRDSQSEALEPRLTIARRYFGSFIREIMMSKYMISMLINTMLSIENIGHNYSYANDANYAN